MASCGSLSGFAAAGPPPRLLQRLDARLGLLLMLTFWIRLKPMPPLLCLRLRRQMNRHAPRIKRPRDDATPAMMDTVLLRALLLLFSLLVLSLVDVGLSTGAVDMGVGVGVSNKN